MPTWLWGCTQRGKASREPSEGTSSRFHWALSSLGFLVGCSGKGTHWRHGRREDACARQGEQESFAILGHLETVSRALGDT